MSSTQNVYTTLHLKIIPHFQRLLNINITYFHQVPCNTIAESITLLVQSYSKLKYDHIITF